MASNDQTSRFGAKVQVSTLDVERDNLIIAPEESDHGFDYSKRSQWLRAAVLGATDGLVSTASLMMGVGAMKQDVKAMVLTGFAGLVAGACSMAIGEFVSVYSQLDIEVAQSEREANRVPPGAAGGSVNRAEPEAGDHLPNPLQAAFASALSFAVGALVPLLAASFITRDYRMRLGVVIAVVTVALVAFGWLGAVLGKAPAVRSSIRVLLGGWVAMAITFGLTKLVGSNAL